jgi:NAD(P)-dependent dehydrogenase (short-subunit alcohol dehydrogenase family)
MAGQRPLEGRIAAITGAARGIGREYALMFAELGAKVVVNDIASSDHVVEEIRAAGGEAANHDGNIADWDEAQALIDTAVSAFGGLNVLVNNAGLLRVRASRWMTREDWNEMLEANLMATVAPIHAAIQHWNAEVEAGRMPSGSIINTSSQQALVAYPGRPAYSAGKAGVAALTVILSQELAPIGIRANCIAPSARTPMSQQTQAVIERMRKPDDPALLDRYDPREIAPLAAYLAEADCPVTGAVFNVSGGLIWVYNGWSRAAQIETDKPWTLEEMRARIPGLAAQIVDGGDPVVRAQMAESYKKS